MGWRRSAVYVCLALLMASALGVQHASAVHTTRALSNGPTVVRGIKNHGAGNSVRMAQITAVPAGGFLDVFMTIGVPPQYNMAQSAWRFNQQLNSIPNIQAFASWASGNTVTARGTKFYTVNVIGVQ